MARGRRGIIILGGLLSINGFAFAQEPCTSIAAQVVSLQGFAGTKVETHRSGDNTICDAWTAARDAHVSLIIEPPSAASGLPMRKMLADSAQEPGTKVKDEPSLGVGAFSVATKEQLIFTAGGKGGVYTLSLNRDAGIGAGDEDELRRLAGKVVDGH
jgi:hypothetical protein